MAYVDMDANDIHEDLLWSCAVQLLTGLEMERPGDIVLICFRLKTVSKDEVEEMARRCSESYWCKSMEKLSLSLAASA